MKKLKINAMIMAAIMGSALASCSSDDLAGDNGNNSEGTTIEMQLSKAADMNCSSNDIAIVENVGVNWYYKVQDNPSTDVYQHFASYAPAKGNNEAVTDDEKNFVIDYIENHKDEGTTAFSHYNYFIQYVGGSHDNYNSVDYPGLKDQKGAAHNVTGSNQIDYIELVNQEGVAKHINDYNANYGPRALVLNLKITGANYHDSWGDKNQTKTDKYKFYTINYNGKDNLYLCYDYATSKNSGETFDGDGVYNDYVIKIIPACDEEVIDPDPTPDPSDPVVVTKGHVEVNLAANDHKDEESSKLSVHVRDTCDFKVFIPVADTYYCAKDDMYIVEKHYENMTYNNLATAMERTIDGQKVTLNVTYAQEGIYIESNGINSTVLKYLRNVYGDGITFEINNYYNPNITRTTLLELLNQSKIEFKNGTTADYRNTIAKDEDGNLINKDSNGNLLDCIVARKD